jgi:hypothetical protein
MNRPFSILLLLATALATGTARSQSPAPAAAETSKSSAASTVAPYQLKNKSVCNLVDGTRSPYWPIGWKPNGAAPVIVKNKVEVDENFFRVTSILLGNPSLAVINGRSYEEGQFIRVPRNAAQIRPKLYRIGDGQVWIQIDTRLYNIPLRRGELNEKKVDEEVLNQDRDENSTVPILKPK